MCTIRHSEPLPSAANESPRPPIALASVICSATPRATSIIASVAMNGGRRSSVTHRPLTSPQAAPVNSPSNIAIGTLMPARTDSAATTPASARIDPTDRSMPPVMITQVAPMPR